MPSNQVIFRVNIEESLRDRLKLLSIKMGITMGDLVSRLSGSSETIADLEEIYGLSSPAPKGKKS